jgi:DnaJ-class molecular chaperone
MLDPYAILQVSRDATIEEIKQAYRRLAKALHPDLNPNNPSTARRFRDVTAAYDVLSDESKRRQHDREAAAAERSRNQSFEESLEGFFRRGWKGGDSSRGFDDSGAGRPPLRGADIYQSLRIGFAEAALGGRKRVAVGDDRAIDLVIPPLTEDGQTLRLKGQGGRGNRGATAGDLFVEISVDPHPLFVRKDLDIRMTLPVTVPEAVLGTTVTVPTLHGMVQLKIPKGSNTDTVLRLRGKGIPALDGSIVGDQFVTLKVILPDAKDPAFTDLVSDWARRHHYSVRPKLGE